MGLEVLETIHLYDYKKMKTGHVYYVNNMWYLWNGYYLANRGMFDTEWHILTKEEIYDLRLKKLQPTDGIMAM